MRETKNTIKFRSRKQSVKGIVALLIAIGTIVASGVMVGVVTGVGGETGVLTGVLGLVFLMVAAGGFVLALKSLYERDVLSVLPITALLLNGFIVIFYLSIYIVGF